MRRTIMLMTVASLFLSGELSRAEVQVGAMAPDFTAPGTGGETIKLADYRGKWVVLYFYPKADTPGCTKQSCSLRDGHDALGELNAVVLGASVDSVAAQERFREKYSLPFPLIADSDKAVAGAYGVLGVGKMMAQRKTFVIDPEGRIAAVIDKVDTGGHTAQVREVLQRLQAQQAP